jgi:kynureninase
VITRADCVRLDAADPLKHFKDEFVLPEGVIYLDGNSLGALPRRTPGRVREMVEREWGEGLIRSWNTAGWYDLPRGLGDRLAPLVGAAPGQVVVCDSTSVNLFKVLATALRLRPGRRTVLCDADSFPTDLYIAQGLEGVAYQAVRPDDLASDLSDQVAAVLLSHVDYRTGRLYDMAAITELVHRSGALMIWDLCHTAGALPIALDDCAVDFAVGCTYKYLNGGPGSPAFLYAACRHHEAAAQPLTGWFGHADPFAFDPRYAPAEGIGRFLVGTPPLLSFAGLQAALETWEKVDLGELRAKSGSLTALFIDLLPDLDLATPEEPDTRGSQVSFRHPDGYPIVQALIDRGVIGDFRAPDIMRFGFAPLYLSHTDVWAAATALKDILATESWRDLRYTTRAAVT